MPEEEQQEEDYFAQQEDIDESSSTTEKGKTKFIDTTAEELEDEQDSQELREEAQLRSQPVEDDEREIVYANGRKYRRAQETLDLIRGDKQPNDHREEQRIEHYTRQLQQHDYTPQDEDALPALYQILGGLIWTPEEYEQAQRQKEEEMEKARKQKIE